MPRDDFDRFVERTNPFEYDVIGERTGAGQIIEHHAIVLVGALRSDRSAAIRGYNFHLLCVLPHLGSQCCLVTVFVGFSKVNQDTQFAAGPSSQIYGATSLRRRGQLHGIEGASGVKVD